MGAAWEWHAMCESALGTQHSKGMQPIMSSVTYPTLVYFFTLSHNCTVFGKKHFGT